MTVLRSPLRPPLRSPLFSALRQGGGGWTPVSLGSSLIAWWTADRSDLMTLSGAQVTSWRDVVGAYDMVQGVSAARPIYSATSFNGAPGLTYDGIDDEMTLVGVPIAFPIGATAGRIRVIAQQDTLASATTASQTFFSYGNVSTTTRALERTVVTGVNRARIRSGDGSVSQIATGSTVDLSSRHVIDGDFGASTSALSVDANTPVTVASIPATANTRVRAGSASGTSGAQFLNGKLRHVFIYTDPGATLQAQFDTWALAQRML